MVGRRCDEYATGVGQDHNFVPPAYAPVPIRRSEASMRLNRSTRHLLRSGAVATLAAALAATVIAAPAYAEDKGFYYGADSGAPSASGTNGSGVYQYPSVCGSGH